jgi:signal peptidase I
VARLPAPKLAVATADGDTGAKTLTDRNILTSELVSDTLRSSGSVTLRATGSSMLPAVWPGDLLHIEKRAAAHIQPGEIVVFECFGHLLIHRMIGRCSVGVTAKGDAVPQADPLVREEDILGIVTSLNRNGRQVGIQKNPGLISRFVSAVVGKWMWASKALQRGYALVNRVRPKKGDAPSFFRTRRQSTLLNKNERAA